MEGIWHDSVYLSCESYVSREYFTLCLSIFVVYLTQGDSCYLKFNMILAIMSYDDMIGNTTYYVGLEFLWYY